MAIDFRDKVNYFGEREQYDNYISMIDNLDECPICHRVINKEYIINYAKPDGTRILVCGCPNDRCGELFFVYLTWDTDGDLCYEKCAPNLVSAEEFALEIEDISPNFIDIYKQAYQAESLGLNLICGPAYRKSLEYLIKDYAISINPESTDTIKAKPLVQCMKDYIEDNRLKAMAERAAWLGNDETHYVRKWEDRDLKDLKNLIKLTVHFIQMNILAELYEKEMTR